MEGPPLADGVELQAERAITVGQLLSIVCASSWSGAPRKSHATFEAGCHLKPPYSRSLDLCSSIRGLDEPGASMAGICSGGAKVRAGLLLPARLPKGVHKVASLVCRLRPCAMVAKLHRMASVSPLL